MMASSARLRFATRHWVWVLAGTLVLIATGLVGWSAIHPADSRFMLVVAQILGGLAVLLGGSEFLRLRTMLAAQRLAMVGAHDGIWVWDPLSKELNAGERLMQILGYDKDVIADTHAWLEIVHPEDRGHYNHEVSRHLKGLTEHFYCEYRVRASNGEYRWLASRGMAERDRRGVARLMAGSVTDITERRAQEEQVRYLAHHDHLTGLPNRLLLADRVERALAAARREDSMVALLFIDMDRFKDVNDSLGHTTGDTLLQAVATRLTGLVREADTVARQGGDEFIVLLPSLADAAQAMQVAEKIVAAFRQTVTIGEREFYINASVGLGLFPRDGTDLDTLLRAADTAMYAAKHAGGNAVGVVDERLRADASRRLSMEYRLHRALANGEFRLYYQPKVGIHGNTLCGAEALLRWIEPDGTLQSPLAFIPLAEETGLIEPIGDWVIHEAVRQIAAWREAGGMLLPVAINLSPRQFRRTGLAQRILDCLAAAQVPTALLAVEVTESVLLESSADVLKELGMLREAGVGVSLDDFGTGYSSLSYLRLLPVDTLKIDRSFVLAMDEVPHGQGDPVAIVRAVVELAHALNLSTVVEGVETEAQLQRLRELDCDSYQGYLFSRPLPADEFARLINMT